MHNWLKGMLVGLALGLLCFSSTIFAQNGNGSSSCEDCYYRGYDDGYDDAYEECPCPQFSSMANLGRAYVALALGFNSFLFNRHINFENERLFNLRAGANAALLNLMLGYTLIYYSNFYLAAELFYTLNSGSSSNSSNLFGYDTRVSVGNSYGLAFIPGWRLLNMLYFLRFGLLRTEFSVRDNIAGLFNTSRHESVDGCSFGVGVETNVYKNFDLRIEANHIKYRSFNSPIGSKNSFSDNQAQLTGVYRFSF